MITIAIGENEKVHLPTRKKMRLVRRAGVQKSLEGGRNTNKERGNLQSAEPDEKKKAAYPEKVHGALRGRKKGTK